MSTAIHHDRSAHSARTLATERGGGFFTNRTQLIEQSAVDCFHAVEVPEWTSAAPCADHSIRDAFFPVRGNSGSAARAKRTCRTQCPVRNECARHTLDIITQVGLGRMVGIWAGEHFIHADPQYNRDSHANLLAYVNGQLVADIA